jgi:hypothetical protein
MEGRYARSMKKHPLAVIALIVTGTLNLVAFINLAGHGEYVPASYSQDYLSGANVPAQLPAWIDRMP